MTPADEQNHRGILLMKAGRPTEAADAFAKAILLDPSFAGAHSNLGAAHLQTGNFEQSLVEFGRAVELQPTMASAYMGQAASLAGLGRMQDAVAIYRMIIDRFPEMVDAPVQLGHLLLQMDELPEAINCYQRVLTRWPNRCDALGGLGSAQLQLGQMDEAERTFRRVVEIQPRSAIGWTNLGNLLRMQLRVDDAQAAYERAIELAPAFAPPAANLGIVLLDQGQAEAAVAVLRKAVTLDPASAAIQSNLVYACCFCPGMDAEQQLKEAKAWASRHATPKQPTSAVAAAAYSVTPGEGRAWEAGSRRLRIGYIGPDFRDHVVGRNVLPIVEHHDREAFEIHIFATVIQPDAMTDRFQQSAEHWHSCAGQGTQSIARLIRDQRIDILVDLTLHMQGNQLGVFARKPAPIAVTWAGYPGTTGLSAIDFRITDPYLDPPGETDRFYAEQSFRLPNSFWCYRPCADCPEVNELPAISAGHITFGCLNNFAKVTSAAIDLWSGVLRAVANSRLLILAPPGKARQRTLDRFASVGISKSRVGFLDRSDLPGYLRLYRQIDISLDPTPYTGHSTTLDSLWMGVPVVTLAGNTVMSRGSVTGLSHTGLSHLIAQDAGQYAEIARGLSADLSGLAKVRAALRAGMAGSPICNQVQFTRDLEAVYRRIHRQCDINPVSSVTPCSR